MAKKVATNPFLSIGGTDYTSYISSMTINYSREEIDASVSTSTGGKGRIAGLYDWSIDVEFWGDLANGGITETLFGLVGTQSAVIAKLDGSTTAATNPKYTGNGIFFDFPMGGEVGAKMGHTLQIKCSDGVPLARAESD
jgi:hypothetical protein